MPTSIDPIDYKNTILSELTAAPVGKPRDYSAAYGGIPELPAYTQSASTAIGPDVQAQLIANLPMYQPLVAQSSQNIYDWSRGRVGSDVVANLMTRQAEMGRGRGFAPDSPNINAAYLRALGLTSNQMQMAAESALTAAVQRTPIQQMQTTSQVTPLAVERAQYAAAPSPEAAANAALQAALAGIAAGRFGAVQPNRNQQNWPQFPYFPERDLVMKRPTPPLPTGPPDSGHPDYTPTEEDYAYIDPYSKGYVGYEDYNDLFADTDVYTPTEADIAGYLDPYSDYYAGYEDYGGGYYDPYYDL